jgi:hypothetical protein
MRLRVVDRKPGSNRLLIRADNESGWYLMSCCGGEVSVIHNECKYVDQLEIRQKVILQFVNLHGFLWLVVFINRHVFGKESPFPPASRKLKKRSLQTRLQDIRPPSIKKIPLTKIQKSLLPTLSLFNAGSRSLRVIFTDFHSLFSPFNLFSWSSEKAQNHITRPT